MGYSARPEPEIAVSLVSIGALAIVAVVVGAPFPLDFSGFGTSAVAVGLLAASVAVRYGALRRAGAGWRRQLAAELGLAARVWTPFVLLYAHYRGLAPLMEIVAVTDCGPRLASIDEALLGASPAWSLQSIVTPWLTELMAYAYGTMFILPLALMLFHYARGERAQLRELSLALLIAFHLGLMIYLAVPTRSPRLVANFPVELEGVVGLYELSTRWWDHATRLSHDAFPSLHTAISTIALVAASRTSRRALAIAAPHVALLQLSTLYLRQHYFIDLVGGWVLALFALWAAPKTQGLSCWTPLKRMPERDCRGSSSSLSKRA